ncbi:heat shock factor [Fusarium pseudoanthophilum]|uniref:Heat shock factor n=1 Tax=Fusarium pseudoanthophilum TaxID=48495 RepID=A0A8H5NP15_9HYPO|nr:heat shock factor [Fusarium pseudoanthophilum]
MMPIPQPMQPQYNTGNPAGDQVMRWNGMGDPSSFMNGADGIMDGNAHVGNSFGLVPAQPQYAQPVSTPSNTLARRQMNRALVPTNTRPYDGAVEPWGNFVGDDNALLQQAPSENLNEQDNVEILEEMAQKAKREAQAKRKQIPPFVQKLSSFLEERKNEDLIRWSEKGDSFIVLDEDEFAKTLIPELFKHNNYASFVRQLNMYGFHKRVGLSDNSMRASERKNKSPSEYSNPYFRRGHPNLLWLINKPKSGSKAKKGAKGAEIDNDSEDEGATEEILASGLGASAAQAPRSLPAADSQPIPKKEMTLVREELSKVREQQKLILGAINRLQRNNNDLYQQAVMFQNQHDRHQNSINAILNFLANVFRKTLEDQGNSQNVNDIISSMLTNQNPQSAQHGSVVDLGDFIQQMDPSSYGTPHKKARGLLPPIPNQSRAQSVRSSTPNRSTPVNSTYQTVNHHNPEMGHVTELQENSPSDTNSPNLRQELEANPHEQMLKMINEHNATNNHGMDLPEAAELVANAPNTLSNAQRSKLVNFMAGQSSSAPSARSTPAPTPVSATPVVPAAAQIPTSNAHMAMPTMPTSTSVSPPPIESNPAPSLSPIMGPPMAPPSLNEINTNQLDLDQLQRLQSEQDAKISELGSILGPLSPSGHVPGLGDNEAYFDPQSADFDQFFDSNALFGDGQYNTDGTDFNFSLDTDPSHPNSALHTGHPIPHVSHHNTPSPAGTEEITRNDLRLDSTPDRGIKRQRVG